ncbi:MAG: type II toxin-antitoxin system VapC family toxin [Candidatus Bipolaricaulota bacterium]|nr:type II toxin-antitoxin system VapC family toxin [Candidatus Bipolaricaulota bacterium]
MIAYLDTSALVKLYVKEAGSAAVRTACDHADALATSRLSYVEAHAAAARRTREGDLSQKAKAQLAENLERDWQRYAVVEVTEAVCSVAVELVGRHPLRAADALQLASALFLRESSGQPILFLCFDERLVAAAQGEGLAVG